MRRTILAPVAFVAALAAAACTGDAPTAPVASGTSAVAQRGQGWFPGQRRTSAMTSGKSTPINCVPKTSSVGTARIGASGGTLYIGRHRLIVPPGALTKPVQISGTVPAGKPFEIDLQPHGLQFRKAAGLILDASNCTNVPTIVYLIDQINVSPPIPAFYSNWWHTIACPIWHFSGYAIATGPTESPDESSTQ
jgi:hypothetical protein